jgi:hypothetical protein
MAFRSSVTHGLLFTSGEVDSIAYFQGVKGDYLKSKEMALSWGRL